MKAPLILASASPRRRQLLAEHGFRAEVCPAPIRESAAPWLTARELVLLNARRKGAAVAATRPGNVTVGADTLVSLDGQVLGKPRDMSHAQAMLAQLSGREHVVYSGVFLARGADVQASFVEETRVAFRTLGPEQIRAYHSLIDPLDKAGAYAAQEHGELIIAGFTGSWTNILGLPMERLTKELAERFGLHPAARSPMA